MSFGVGVGAFAQGFVGGYNAVQNAEARKQENEMRQQQLEMQKAQVEREKAYQTDLAKLSETFLAENRVQTGTDEMGQPVFTTKPMSYEQQMRYASAAADVSMRHMKLNPSEFMQIAKTVEEARKEGTMDAIKAAHVGDLDGALDSFNRSGRKLGREDVVGFDQTEVVLPGGVKMPSRVIRMKDGTTINTAEWLMKGMAFEKLYEVGARRQESQEGRAHDARLLDRRLAHDAAQGAADRGLRAQLAREDVKERQAARAHERMPTKVREAQWYANEATPQERAQYDRMNADERREFVAKLATNMAGNIAYQPDQIPAAAEAVANGVYGGGGYGVGNGAAAPAPAAAPAAPAAAAGPRPGDVMDGYRFKGGNPADMNSWEKVR